MGCVFSEFLLTQEQKESKERDNAILTNWNEGEVSPLFNYIVSNKGHEGAGRHITKHVSKWFKP